MLKQAKRILKSAIEYAPTSCLISFLKTWFPWVVSCYYHICFDFGLSRKIQSQMCPKLLLVVVPIHTGALGCRWCDKPNKKLEKNSDPPIINPIIRERERENFSNFCRKIQSQMCPQLYMYMIRAFKRWQSLFRKKEYLCRKCLFLKNIVQ